MVLYLWRYVVPDPLNYTENPPFFRCEKVIDDACSVIWCERYQEPGEIALVLRATPELLRFFWQAEIMITRDDTDRAMFVEDVVLTTSADNGDYIRITGVSAEGLTKRRVIGQRGAVTDMDATAAIRYYMQENIGAYWYFYTDDEHQHGRNNPYCRMYVNLLVKGEDDERITEKISAEPFGENLLDFIVDICKGNEFGYQITFDGEKLVYRSYRGDDRTLNQDERNAVVFAEEFLNLGNSEYEYSRDAYYSHVIAGGSGTGSTREYGESFTGFRTARGCGLNLRQKFINASGTSGNMLRIAAQNEVLSARETVNFTAEAQETGQFAYREDYFLGDRVSVVNRYGISGTATVTEVVETEDENGRYCIPTLSQFDALEYITPERPPKTSDFRRIKYIQSTGTQYLLTDIVPKNTSKIELRIDTGSPDYSITGNQYLFGWYANQTLGSFCIILSGSQMTLGYQDVRFYNGFSWYSGASGDNTIYNCYMVGVGDVIMQRGVCSWNYATATTNQEVITYPEPSTGLPIFAGIDGHGDLQIGKRRDIYLYSFKLYDNGVLMHELVPVERKGDGKPGLFDTYTGKFYTNAGTGEFVKGGYVDEEV